MAKGGSIGLPKDTMASGRTSQPNKNYLYWIDIADLEQILKYVKQTLTDDEEEKDSTLHLRRGSGWEACFDDPLIIGQNN